MIYLIVGQPRSGKSQYAVKVAFDLHEKNNKIQEKINTGKELKSDEVVRKIYSDIDEFALRNDFIHDAPADWRDVDDGSVIIYDEVHFREEYQDQNKYMSKNPMILELSTHGHRNIDIYLITQDPRRLEKSIRALIFKMYLVKRPANLPPFANVYTFDRWLGDPWAASKNKDNVHDEQLFHFRKKYQDAYKSASAHTSVSFKIQRKFIFAIIAIILMIALSVFLFKISGTGKLVDDALNVSKQKEQTTVSSDKIMQSSHGKPNSTQTESTAEEREKDRRKHFNDELHRVNYNVNKPYDFDSTQYQYKVTQTPILSGCLVIDKICTCYTQQATRINMTQKDCKRYMSGDKPFNPFMPNSAPSSPIFPNDSSTQRSYEHQTGELSHGFG